MANVVGRKIQQQPDMCIREPIVDPATIAPRAHHIRRTKQPHRLTHHVLRNTRDPCEIAHTQLAALQQSVQDRQPRRITQQPEQLGGLDVRLTARHPTPQRAQRYRRFVAMRRTDIEINNRSLARHSHDRHHICAAEQITQQTLTGDTQSWP